MNNLPNLEDLAVFVQVAKRASFAAAASELGMSTAFISKRIRLLEQNLDVRLLHRTTRRVSVSEDGERVYHWALRILDSVQRMGDEVSALHREPSGQLRIASSLGLGRRFVAPALSELAARYPQLDIRLDVHDRLVDLVAEGVDLDIRVGNEIAANLIAKPLAKNRRVLCAAPAYLERRDTPRSLAELTSHDCLVIKERDHPFGVWHLEGPSGEENVKVTGPLSSNHGEVVHQAEAGPAGGQHGSAQVVVGQPVQLTEHVLALAAQEGEQGGRLVHGFRLWHRSSCRSARRP